METINETPANESPRGLRALIRQFFSWRHLIPAGAACCLALSLLCYLYIGASRLLVSYILCPLSILLFVIMLVRGNVLRRPDIKLLLAAFVWLNLVYILNIGRLDIAAGFPYYANACAVALLCYPLAYALRPERRMKTFDLLAWLWTVPVACSAVLGIGLVLSGTVLYRQSDMAAAGLVGGRLALICDSNMYGMLCCIALCLVFYLLLGKRRPAVKVLLALAALCLFIALTLTDSRTSKFALLPVAFFFAAILVRRPLADRKKLFRLLVGALAGLAFCAVLLLASRAVNSGFNAVLLAREPETDESVDRIAGRGLSDTNTASNRLKIWTRALDRLSDEPDVLLRGATPALTHEIFLDRSDGRASYNHLHNAYLAVLLGYGLPGFLLMLAFFVYLAVCACRLLFSARHDLPAAIRFLPTVLLAILAINLFEEMLFTRNFVSELDVWLGVIGGYTVVLSRAWRGSGAAPNDTAAPPLESA